jgi:hypothetical protein
VLRRVLRHVLRHVLHCAPIQVLPSALRPIGKVRA